MSATLAAALVFALAGPPEPVPFEELPPQRLDSGQCALFLWTRETPPRRVFMALQTPALARLKINGGIVELPRVSAEGEAVFGHPPVQRYAGAGYEMTVRIQAEVRSGMAGGAVAPSASIEYRSADGWQTVIPAAGIVGCQS